MRPSQLEQITKHGENLNAIFNTGLDPVTLCKKLRRLENKANKLATDYCNGDNGIDSENWEQKCKPILTAVFKILNRQGNFGKIPVYINRDARGYALKISDKDMRAKKLTLYSDWGGYGILAPEFN